MLSPLKDEFRRGPTEDEEFLDLLDSQPLKQLIRPIVKLRQTRSVVRITFGDANDHALAGAGEEDTVGVKLVGAAFGNVDVLPTVGAEIEVLPAMAMEIIAEVAIPNEAGPIQFQTLDIELGSNVLEE